MAGNIDYDEQDRLTEYDGVSYDYHPWGAVHHKGSIELLYDVLGNLRRFDDGATVIDYVIDPKGRRVGRKKQGAPGEDRYWLYRDDLNPVAELDENGDLRARFVYGSRAHVPDYMVLFTGGGEELYRILSDQLGRVRLVVKLSDGSIAQEIEYDEWGVVLSDSNPGFQPFGFAGGLYDPVTKLVRFGARELRRWARFALAEIGKYDRDRG